MRELIESKLKETFAGCTVQVVFKFSANTYHAVCDFGEGWIEIMKCVINGDELFIDTLSGK